MFYEVPIKNFVLTTYNPLHGKGGSLKHVQIETLEVVVMSSRILVEFRQDQRCTAADQEHSGSLGRFSAFLLYFNIIAISFQHG